MAKTSTKLYGIKNDVLRKSVGKIDVKNSEELLLLEAPSNYESTFRELGIPSKQDFVNDQLKESRQLKIFQDKYKNSHEAFKGHHIKKLCNTYDLMILPTSNIKGYLDDNAMKAIRDFNAEFDKTLLSDSVLYILAPRECFYNSFKGKEVKTYIIFYKDSMNDGGSSYRTLDKSDIVNQVFASGNDFSSLRVFNQLFLTKNYAKDQMPRIYGNILFSLVFWIALGLVTSGSMVWGTVFFVGWLVSMAIYNTNDRYRGCWNEFSDYHSGY